MNCKKAKPLIPLFVEDDLDAAELQQVTEHLATCDSCCEIVAEFQASQSSLHAAALPEFDEAMLSAMRTAVQREIARPTLADWLALLWSWKLAGAAAACLLVGAFMLYRQVSPAPKNKPAVAREQQTVAPAAIDVRATNSAARGTVPRAVASYRPARKPSPYPSSLATARGTVPPLAAPPVEPVHVSPVPALALTAIPETAASASEPEMLRMEIHTADPNIKIIWLTPKEPMQTNPLTETK